MRDAYLRLPLTVKTVVDAYRRCRLSLARENLAKQPPKLASTH